MIGPPARIGRTSPSPCDDGCVVEHVRPTSTWPATWMSCWACHLRATTNWHGRSITDNREAANCCLPAVLPSDLRRCAGLSSRRRGFESRREHHVSPGPTPHWPAFAGALDRRCPPRRRPRSAVPRVSLACRSGDGDVVVGLEPLGVEATGVLGLLHDSILTPGGRLSWVCDACGCPDWLWRAVQGP
jgi:hypothetical protein